MNRRSWSDICRKSNYRELAREDRAGGVVLFAEGVRNGRKSVLWAFGRDDEKLEIARPMEFHDWYEDNGLHRPVSCETMLAAAKEDAFGWLAGRNQERLPVMRQNLRDGGALHG